MIPWCLILPICTRRTAPVTKRLRGNGRGSKSRVYYFQRLGAYSNQGMPCRTSELFILPRYGCLDYASTFLYTYHSRLFNLWQPIQHNIEHKFCHSGVIRNKVLFLILTWREKHTV